MLSRAASARPAFRPSVGPSPRIPLGRPSHPCCVPPWPFSALGSRRPRSRARPRRTGPHDRGARKGCLLAASSVLW